MNYAVLWNEMRREWRVELDDLARTVLISQDKQKLEEILDLLENKERLHAGSQPKGI